MNTNYKKIIFASMLSGFVLLNSNCKKQISSHPFEMEGAWYAPDAFSCGGPVLIIEKNCEGKFLSHSGNCDTRDPEVDGKVKYKKNVLYIDNRSYNIVQKPEAMSQVDSIRAPDASNLSSKTLRKYRILAKMTLQEKKVLTNEGKYTFYKYVDY